MSDYTQLIKNYKQLIADSEVILARAKALGEIEVAILEAKQIGKLTVYLEACEIKQIGNESKMIDTNTDFGFIAYPSIHDVKEVVL